MGKIEKKSLDSPDERKTFKNQTHDIVNLPGMTLGRFNCQAHHVGIILSGQVKILLTDGTETDLRPGDTYDIPRVTMPG
jgi:hypothetical protein